MPKKGHKMTQAQKDKISAAMIGKQNFLGHKHTEETRANISAAMMGHQNALGYKVSEETKVAISIALTGRTLSEEHRANMSAAWTPQKRAAKSAEMMGNQYANGNQNFLGHKLSDEAKTKISAAMKGNQHTLGYKHTKATRANMSAAQKARAQTEEGKAILIRATQAACVARPTRLEKALYKMLDAFGWEYDTEVAFPPYFVDAYIPGLHLALEADGPFHFKGNPFIGTTAEEEAEATRTRDAYLQEHYDLKILHLTEKLLMSNGNQDCLAIEGA